MDALRLGDKVRDVVTGYEGIATQSCRYLTGCDRIGVEGPADKKGRWRIEFFDITRLEVVEAASVDVEPVDTQGLPG